MATWKAVLGVVVLGYAIIVAGLYLFQRRLIYLPSTDPPDRVSAGAADMREVTLTTADGLVLNAWWRPPEGERATIIFFHGNAGNIGHRPDRVRPYMNAGYGMLLVDYRGYGGNPGRPTETGLYADGRAALAFVAGQGIAPDGTVLYGESLGGGVAVQMALEQAGLGAPVGAVVLEAPFSSVPDMAAEHYRLVPGRWLVRDRFDNVAKIGGIEAPLFVAHGDSDYITPQRLGMRVFDAAEEPKVGWWPDGAGHIDLGDFGLPDRVIEFLEEKLDNCGAARSSGSVQP